MAQWVKLSAVQPDDLSSSLRTYMVERTDSQKYPLIFTHHALLKTHKKRSM